MNTMKLNTMKLAIPLLVALACSPSQGLAAPLLGTSEKFTVLGASTVTNTNPVSTPTTITGDLGLYTGPSVTGFAVTNTVSNGAGSTGLVSDFNGLVSGTIHIRDADAITAQSDAVTAYNALRPFSAVDPLNLTGLTIVPTTIFAVPTDLGGMTLTPGVYRFDSSAAITGTLNLNFGLTPNAAFVFQIGSTLKTAAENSIVNVIGDGALSGIYWQVGSSATLGTNTMFAGNIIAAASDTVTTGANICGRVWALSGAVTMDTNKISNNCGLSNSYSSGLVLDSTGHAQIVAEIPEPETYAMMLAGLGLMGWVARRRKQQQVAA